MIQFVAKSELQPPNLLVYATPLIVLVCDYVVATVIMERW